MNFLLIGDLHVKPDNIEESNRFIQWISGLCKEKSLIPIFMGDQYDTHGNIRVEVLDFWQKAYDLFVSSYSIVGNHDMDYSCEFTSMLSNSKQTKVINTPFTLSESTITIPYIKSSQEFTNLINNLNDKIKFVLCHQEFYGAQYEGGFYAPTGVKLEEIKKDVLFISGHIHKKQNIADKTGKTKVIYVGTPRQLTRSDIDEIKGVHIWHNESQLEFIPTPEEVCQQFKKITIIQNCNEDVELSINNKTFVDVHGDENFIKKIIKKLPEEVKIRTFPIKENKKIEIKESSGIKNAFKDYFENYVKANNLNEQESKEIFEIIKNNCNSVL
jgi:hypothetical protein